MTILGFTGTQAGMNWKQRQDVLTFLLSLKSLDEVHHGDCIGADADFHDMIRINFPLTKIVIHPPHNGIKRANKGSDFIHPTKDYLERNHDIVDACEILIVVPKRMFEEQQSGTWATKRYADKQRKQTKIFYPRIHEEGR